MTPTDDREETEYYWERRNRDFAELPAKIAEYISTEYRRGVMSFEDMAPEIVKLIPEYCPYDCDYCSCDHCSQE